MKISNQLSEWSQCVFLLSKTEYLRHYPIIVEAIVTLFKSLAKEDPAASEPDDKFSKASVVMASTKKAFVFSKKKQHTVIFPLRFRSVPLSREPSGGSHSLSVQSTAADRYR